MAAAAGERLSFDSALAATFKDVKLNVSLRKEQITALKSFSNTSPWTNFHRSDYVTSLVALIGCSAILLRAEGT